MPSRCILVLLDGLGDRSHSELNHLTPLAAARTPNLDKLAAAGMCGLYHGGTPGTALSSEDAHFALFGYPAGEFPGRGLLEALGAGLDPGDRDVAVLAHLVTAANREGVLVLEKDRPDVPEEETGGLFDAIGSHAHEGVQVRFHRARGLDGILILTGDVSHLVTDTDPMREGAALMEVLPLRAAGDDPAASRTARVLKQYLLWCHKRLTGHPLNAARTRAGKPPVNAVVTQRPGRQREVESFRRRWGLDGLSISSGILYTGLARFLGMEAVTAADGPDPGEDLRKRLDLALDRISDFDFIHVHTKAPDTAAHTKNPRAKVKVIEKLDRGLGAVLDRLTGSPDILLAVTSDHSTPSSTLLIHSGEPVPLVFVGEGVRRDGVDAFDEVSCARGALGLVRGREFMHWVLNYLERARLAGIMDTPVDRPYWPGDYEPFRVE